MRGIQVSSTLEKNLIEAQRLADNGMKELEMTMENDELISGKCWDKDGNEKKCESK